MGVVFLNIRAYKNFNFKILTKKLFDVNGFSCEEEQQSKLLAIGTIALKLTVYKLAIGEE